jgi:hypothetical protein
LMVGGFYFKFDTADWVVQWACSLLNKAALNSGL